MCVIAERRVAMKTIVCCLLLLLVFHYACDNVTAFSSRRSGEYMNQESQIGCRHTPYNKHNQRMSSGIRVPTIAVYTAAPYQHSRRPDELKNGPQENKFRNSRLIKMHNTELILCEQCIC